MGLRKESKRGLSFGLTLVIVLSLVLVLSPLVYPAVVKTSTIFDSSETSIIQETTATQPTLTTTSNNTTIQASSTQTSIKPSFPSEESINSPLADPICGNTIIANTVLTGNLLNSTGGNACTGNGLIIGADNITLDCSNFTIKGSGATSGVVVVNRKNITIRNCTIVKFVNGINFSNSNISRITKNVFMNNTYGVRFTDFPYANLIDFNLAINNNIGLGISWNNTVRDNIANNNQYGLYFQSLRNGRAINNTAYYNSLYGMYLTTASNDTIINNILKHNSIGLTVGALSNNNIIHSNILENNTNGVNFGTGNNNSFYNNYMANKINAYADQGNVINWNITKTAGTNIVGGPFLGGNFWSNYLGIDNNGDGIGDTNIPYNNVGNITVGGDYLPLKIISQQPPIICGTVINSSISLAGNLLNSTGGTTCQGDGLIINSSNLILDCRGYTISGKNLGNGISSFGRMNVTIKNCYVQEFFSGFNLTLTNNSLLLNNTATDNIYVGFSFSSSNNNNITRNRGDRGEEGFVLLSSRNNSLILNNASGNNRGFYLINASNNLLLSNGAGVSIEDGGNNQGFVVINSSNNNSFIDNLASENSDGIVVMRSNNFLLDCNGKIIDGYGVGSGVFVLNGANITVKNCYVSEFLSGYNLTSTNSSLLVNNTATDNNYAGFVVVSSSNNTLTRNRGDRGEEGFVLLSSRNNSLILNNASGDNRGFYLINASNNLLLSNGAGVSINGGNNQGFYLLNSPNNNLTSNKAINGSEGFSLNSSSNNYFYKNIASDNVKEGFIFASNSNHNTLVENLASFNNDGIVIQNSSKNTITTRSPSVSVIYYNSHGALFNKNNGFLLQNASNNKFINFVANENRIGINISSSNANTFEPIYPYCDYSYWNIALDQGNTEGCPIVNLNNAGGIVLTNSNTNTILYTTLDHNNIASILLQNSTNNKIKWNQLFLSDYYPNVNNHKAHGIRLVSSPDNFLINNDIMAMTYDGIGLSSNSNGNYLSGNVISYSGSGIFVANSHRNNIQFSKIKKNGNGIVFFASDNNNLHSNTICYNNVEDISVGIFGNNNGTGNSCYKSNGWNDYGKTGCTSLCNDYPVLLVHGYCDDPYSMNSLAIDLNNNGFNSTGKNNIFILDYAFGENANGNIKTYARILGNKINSIKQETGASRVNIVAHSMGGLISRWYIQHQDYRYDVDQLIMLGTPNHGSKWADVGWLADLGAEIFSGCMGKGKAEDQMKPESSFLASLNYNQEKFDLNTWQSDNETISNDVLYRNLAGTDATFKISIPVLPDKTIKSTPYVKKKYYGGTPDYYWLEDGWTHLGDVAVSTYLLSFVNPNVGCDEFKKIYHQNLLYNENVSNKMVYLLRNPNITQVDSCRYQTKYPYDVSGQNQASNETNLFEDLMTTYEEDNDTGKNGGLTGLISGNITNGSLKLHVVNIDSMMDIAIFNLVWENNNSDINFTLIMPNGTLITPLNGGMNYSNSSQHKSYFINNPQPGNWTLQIYADNIPSESDMYASKTFFMSSLSLHSFIKNGEHSVDPGQNISLVAFVSFNESISIPVNLTVQINKPDSSTFALTLYDDGLHGDFDASDYFYGNNYSSFDMGSYDINVRATGVYNDATFTRHTELTRWVELFPDLALSPSDIYFSNENPIINADINITAQVHNLGTGNATNATILFYDGDPRSGGFLIGENRTNITTNSDTNVSINWTTTEGYHEIVILVSPYNDFLDSNYNNEKASRELIASSSFICGDVNNDGVHDILDVVNMVNVAFRGQNQTNPPPFEVWDVDASGAIDIIDVVKIINVAFRGVDVSSPQGLSCNEPTTLVLSQQDADELTDILEGYKITNVDLNQYVS